MDGLDNSTNFEICSLYLVLDTASEVWYVQEITLFQSSPSVSSAKSLITHHSITNQLKKLHAKHFEGIIY